MFGWVIAIMHGCHDRAFVSQEVRLTFGVIFLGHTDRDEFGHPCFTGKVAVFLRTVEMQFVHHIECPGADFDVTYPIISHTNPTGWRVTGCGLRRCMVMGSLSGGWGVIDSVEMEILAVEFENEILVQELTHRHLDADSTE